MQNKIKNINLSSKNKTMRVISRILRWAILGALLTFVLVTTILHTLGYAAPSIHGTCPYGGLESALSFITLGVFIKKIYLGTLILFAVSVGLALIFRRAFCGQLCAFGGLQEFFGNLGRKIFKKRRKIPRKLDYVLRYIKIVVLLVTIGMAWVTAELWITPYDPYNALGRLGDFYALITTYLVGFILLIVTLVGSLVYERFFCKYLCPAGALYSIIGKISPYKVRRDDNKCTSCGICDKACPMNVKVMEAKNGKVNDGECINCNECVNVCPTKGALNTGFSRKAIISPLIAIVLVAIFFFVPILIARANGAMQILPNKFVNEKGGSNQSLEKEENEQDIGAEEGENRTSNTINSVGKDDIKGSMSIADIALILDIPIEQVYEKLQLDDDFPEGNTIKSAAESQGIEVSELKGRLFE